MTETNFLIQNKSKPTWNYIFFTIKMNTNSKRGLTRADCIVCYSISCGWKPRATNFIIPGGYADCCRIVWKLRKSLYGLKQSGRNWFRLLESFLLDDCSFQNNIDPCTFILRTDADEKMIILVWVDDLIMVSSSHKLLNCIKEQLKKRFEMKDLGEVIHFLGIEFSRDKDKTMMKQTKNIHISSSTIIFIARSTRCALSPFHHL